jgi:hypothetical protein
MIFFTPALTKMSNILFNHKGQKLQAILFLLSIGKLSAQTDRAAMNKKMADSMRLAYLSAAAIRYPILRQAFVSSDLMGAVDLSGKLNGNILFKAKAQLNRTRTNFNLPLVQWGKNTLTISVSYLNQRTGLEQVAGYDTEVPVRNSTINTATLGLSASYTRVDSLFHHAVIYSATVTGLTNELSAIRRVNEIAGVNIPIVRTATTAFSVGLYYINDPTIPTHVLPFVSYWHAFQTEKIQFFADLPYRISLKKQLSERSWISVGTELSGSESFLSLENGLPQNAISSTLECKTGPTFEHLLGKKIILGISGGLFSTLSSRIFRQGGTPADYFMNSSSNSTSFINVSISFLPFLKAVNKYLK